MGSPPGEGDEPEIRLAAAKPELTQRWMLPVFRP